VRQRVVVHPGLVPFFNAVTHAVLGRVLGRDPDNPTLAKAEGMIRFYLEGKRLPSRQDWPEGLAHRKGELLQALQCRIGSGKAGT
jgi:hypothetical protein